MPSEPAAPAAFADFALAAPLVQALAELGYTQPTPVQALVLPPALAGQDVAGQAPTGSGKTAAYGLAALNQLDLAQRAVQVIVLVPARELALQVREALKALGKQLPGLRVAVLYGGHPMRDEVKTLQQTPHVVVATPGRLLDHLEKRNIVPNQLRLLVLDEADKLLDLKFQQEMATIIDRLPRRRQTLLFSATMPEKVLALVREYLTRPRLLTAEGGLGADSQVETTALPASLALHGHLLGTAEEKPAALYHLLHQPGTGQALVFVATRERAQELARFLRGRGVAAEVLHGKLPQPERDKALMKLRNHSAQVLVATDVAARGLDVPTLDTVVQYDLPHEADTFQHRAGRTARAGAAGTAHLLATVPEQARVQAWPAAQAARWARLVPPPLPPASVAPPPRPATVTLHVTAGKKHKVSAHDLVGAFVNVGGLGRDDVGRIEVFDFYSYVAVPRKQATALLEKLNGAKVKGVKVRVTEVE